MTLSTSAIAEGKVVFRPKDKGKAFDLRNASDEYQECRVRVGHDYLWTVMSPGQSLGNFYLADGFYTRHVSLRCLAQNGVPDKKPGIWYIVGRHKTSRPPREFALYYKEAPNAW